jgi:hypothetical protein
MLATLQELHPNKYVAREDVLPALRELFSQHSAAVHMAPETLARFLWTLRYLPYRPPTFAVEAALEVLDVERGAA